MIPPATSGQPAEFELRGLPASVSARLAQQDTGRVQQLFRVYALAADTTTLAAEQPPLLGRYRLDSDGIRFVPRFALAPGVRHRAVFDASALAELRDGASVQRDFVIPERPRSEPTRVTHIYPTAHRLPENLLRWYIHFSAPMRRGEAYSRVVLLDADGKPIVGPFLELGEELWDPSGRRFTLFIDPGRIKHGLRPREDLGPVLEEGGRYTLIVQDRWLDAAGHPLRESFRKAFEVGPPETQPLDPSKWKVAAPSASSRNALTVTFPKTLDHGMVQRVLTIVDDNGAPIAGDIEVAEAETEWRFRPQKPWKSGRYRLVVGTELEDLAGNSVGRRFEVDVFRTVQSRLVSETVALPFEIVAQNATTR